MKIENKIRLHFIKKWILRMFSFANQRRLTVLTSSRLSNINRVTSLLPLNSSISLLTHEEIRSANR